MSIFKKCTFYRDSESLAMGTGLGHCDLFGQAICEGDIQFCQNPEGLRKELLEQKEKDFKKDKEERNQKEKIPTYKVLVVEDEAVVRNLVEKSLALTGYQVLTATDGLDALEIARNYRGEIHLLLTDVVMPRMGGRELAECLRSTRAGLPVLFMSGYTDNAAEARKYVEAGGDFIQKPFTTALLSERVGAALRAAGR